MKQLDVIFKFSLILLCCTLFIPTKQVLANQGIDKDMEKQLDSYIESYLEDYQVPGASMAIIQNNEVVYKKSWGISGESEEKITAKSPFTIGSISKSLTGLAIMKLVDEKIVNLNDPVQKYIPWFTLADEQAAAQITIKHLLTQTSGFSMYNGLLISDKESLGNDSIKNNVKSLSDVNLTSLPGERHQYSNANFIILGALIEEVTHQTYAEYMEQNVFNPLGMKNAAADYKTAYEKGYLSGYQSWFGFPWKTSVTYDNGGAPYGYIAASVEDLVQFIKFLSGKSFDDFLSNYSMNHYLTPHIQTGENRYYGLGIRIANPESNDKMIWHSGSTPDSHSEMFYIPKTDWGGVILTNKNNQLEEEGLYYLKLGIINILNGDLPVDVPNNTPIIQFIILGLICILFVICIYLLVNIRKLRKKGLWAILGFVCLLLLIIIVPLLLNFVQSPWRSIWMFAPDVALLTVLTVILLAFNGLLALRISFKK
ncbi:beta-lactamase family protein [Solibacillus sp. A46]|uniref:Beta-lactamase family protein n=1 Tax=Solibacillus faecavium TaxID=2762221 RepID=A0ABR8Y2J1_9BACL|nr:serine hydrolase domain-containing protein [Solibacillus faecavium]MBD8038430.1 beta-lactamase family protein [Solibacillus faecavium]